jgi:sugar lactone lactonase YvrE
LIILAAILSSVYGCGPGNPPEIGNPSVNQPILNLKLNQSIGPSLSSGVHLVDPSAIAVNDIGEIYISDKARNTVYKLASSLELIGAEGGIGASSGSLNRPMGMAFDAALNLYVAETGNHRVTILDRNLHFVRNYTAYSDADGESIDFDTPSDVSLDREGNVWVADDNRALKLNPFFDLQLEISNDSPGYPIIGEIVSMRVARSGLVAIADKGSRQIIIVRTLGTYITKFPVETPNSVAWDKNANIWVVSNGRLFAYDLNGMQKFEYAGSEPESRIVWATFDAAGNMYVLDAGVRRAQIFEIVYGVPAN